MSAADFFKYVGWQLLVALGLGFIGFGISGYNGAVCSALGSLIALVPNAYFALQAFRYKASEDPVRALGALYRGEAGKFILVVVLSALTFRFVDVQQPLLLFVSLTILLMAQTLVTVLILPEGRNQAGTKKR